MKSRAAAFTLNIDTHSVKLENEKPAESAAQWFRMVKRGKLLRKAFLHSNVFIL